MKVTAVKTDPITVGADLMTVLDTFLPTIHDGDVVAVTSKIVSICQGRVVKITPGVDKHELIRKEAELFYESPEYYEKYHITLTINNGLLIASSGIDESNGNGYYILWPKDLAQTADTLWNHIRETYGISHVGVIITDSHTIPLRWGVTGVGLSWSGFVPLNRYIDTPDIFGRPFQFVNASVLDGLAASTVLVMGEGNEQTPLAVASDVPFVQFMDHTPTDEERNRLNIPLADDIYAPLLTRVPWKSQRK